MALGFGSKYGLSIVMSVIFTVDIGSIDHPAVLSE
ncbi:MAG: Uncharacterised protein [Prochlorococcus marinus str. MIT 9215]|nr:MAG: Uncharacterised protein [Prochlorococcus marinus str. MIT 9215]